MDGKYSELTNYEFCPEGIPLGNFESGTPSSTSIHQHPNT